MCTNTACGAYRKGALPDGVDLVDDLHVPGEQLGHDLDRPLLQGLWHDRVVGERQGLHTTGCVRSCTHKEGCSLQQLNGIGDHMAPCRCPQQTAFACAVVHSCPACMKCSSINRHARLWMRRL